LRVQPITKKYALARGKLGCLGEVATLNVTRGCAGMCVFCYARCLPGMPPGDTIQVYSNLPQRLRLQLDSSRRKSPLPDFVILSTAGDAFLGGEAVLQVTRPCLEILLNRNIGISFSTRGEIPEDLLALLSRHARHVRVFIPLVSMSDDYTRAWEPGAALPRRRLFLAQKLMDAGIRPRFRLDPVIPFVNDKSADLERVLSAVAGLGLKRIIASFLHIRPGVERLIRHEAPEELRRLVLGGFPGLEQRPDRFQYLPDRQCNASLERIRRLARERDLRVSACQCQNPGLLSEPCPVTPPELPGPLAQQTTLF
jgi:DNA repair photolyase